MTTSLYVLTSEYRTAEQKLLESDFDEQTIADTLEGLGGEVQEKATNVAMVVRNMEATAEQIKQAEQAMASRRKALENKAKSIKQYLFNNMKAMDYTKIDCEYFSMAIKKNPPKLVIDDEDAIPGEFKFIPEPVEQVDSKKLKEALKTGNVEGAHLEQGERLEIK